MPTSPSSQCSDEFELDALPPSIQSVLKNGTQGQSSQSHNNTSPSSPQGQVYHGSGATYAPTPTPTTTTPSTTTTPKPMVTAHGHVMGGIHDEKNDIEQPHSHKDRTQPESVSANRVAEALK